MFDGQLTLINNVTKEKLPIEILINIATMLSGEQPYNLYCPITKYLITTPVSIRRTEQGALDPTLIYDKSSILTHHPKEAKNLIEQPAFKALSTLAKICLEQETSILGKEFRINGEAVDVLRFLQVHSRLTDNELSTYPFYRTLKKNIENNTHGYISTVFSEGDKRVPLFLPVDKHTHWLTIYNVSELTLAMTYPLCMSLKNYSEVNRDYTLSGLIFIFTLLFGFIYYARNAKQIVLASSLTNELSTKPVSGKYALPFVWLGTAAAAFGSMPLMCAATLKTAIKNQQDTLFYPLLSLLYIGVLAQCLLTFVTAKLIFHSIPFYKKHLSLNQLSIEKINVLTFSAIITYCYSLDQFTLATTLAPDIRHFIDSPYSVNLLFAFLIVSWLPKIIAFTLYTIDKVSQGSRNNRFSVENIVYDKRPFPHNNTLETITRFSLRLPTRAAIAATLGILRTFKTDNITSFFGYTGALVIEFYLADILTQQIAASFVSLKSLPPVAKSDETIIEVHEMKSMSSKDDYARNSYQNSDEDNTPPSTSRNLRTIIGGSSRKSSEHEEPLLDTSIHAHHFANVY